MKTMIKSKLILIQIILMMRSMTYLNQNNQKSKIFHKSISISIQLVKLSMTKILRLLVLILMIQMMEKTNYKISMINFQTLYKSHLNLDSSKHIDTVLNKNQKNKRSIKNTIKITLRQNPLAMKQLSFLMINHKFHHTRPESITNYMKLLNNNNNSKIIHKICPNLIMKMLNSMNLLIEILLMFIFPIELHRFNIN